MKSFKFCFYFLLTIALFCNLFLSGALAQNLTTSSGKLKIVEVTQPIASTHQTPIRGSGYRMFPAFTIEVPPNSSLGGFDFGIQVDPETGMVNDSILDGHPDTIGFDFADLFGNPAPNAVVSYECVENLGKDPVTGRFIVRLTVGTAVTGVKAQWDSLVLDQQDPLDIDLDGITGKGPDGVYGTEDDVIEPDGLIFDTGDGTLDAAFPLDPAFLTVEIDDPDGGGTVTGSVVAVGLFIGANAGGMAISFEPDAGFQNVISASFEYVNAAGQPADIDNDGLGDGPFDVTSFSVFNDPLVGGWNGSFGAAIFADGIPCTSHEAANGNVRAVQLVATYLSDIPAKEYCFDPFDPGGDCSNPLGDINGDGVVDLLDVNPFVEALTGGKFVCEADINKDGSVDLLDVAPFVALLAG